MHNNKKIRLLIVLPEGRINKLKIGSLIDISFREAPLTATMLAALVPDDIDADIDIVDESVGQRVDATRRYDLAAISVMTGTSIRAYEIAAQLRSRGTTVVLGGVHVTLMPEEARKHADVIVTGFSELTWPQLLRDFIAGRVEDRYHQDTGPVERMPVPRRDLQKRWGYMMPNTVLVTRGCTNECDFCSVPAANYGWHKRDIGEVIAEIRGIKSRRFAVGDVNLTEDADYAKELLRELIPLKKKWGALASTRITEDDELLDLLQRSGCSYLLMGFESFNPASLHRINKGFNRADYYKTVVEKLHAHNILVQGCFIFGFDEDEGTIFEQTVDFVNAIKIDIPRYALYTPYPGTPLFKRLENEGRILHRNWYYYDTQHVVFQPAKMTPAELDRGLLWAYRHTFKVLPSLKRSMASGLNAPVTFLGNLAYKLYIHRLVNDTNRFPIECDYEIIPTKGKNITSFPTM